MARKKQIQPSISQGEQEQVQSLLTHYHQIAIRLRDSTDEQQIVVALTEINNLPASAQIALLKALGGEQQLDAADVLAAVYAFGTLKDARKEARRSLIRLEGARIYPRWEAPLAPTPEVDLFQATDFPPRFLKGQITDSRAAGEMQLILAWEMGEDYREVRVLGFLLEFWHDGIKDFFTLSETRRSFANLLSRMSDQVGIKLKECSLDEGIVLLEEARAVNVKYGTQPHKDYTRHRALIDQLLPENQVLKVIGNTNLRNWEEDEDEDEVDLSDLTTQDVVVNFVEAEIADDLSLAYQLLAQDSPLREGLAKDAWIKRRKAWVEKFNPTALKPAFIIVREPQKSKLWFPAARSKQKSEQAQEVEAGWSVEFSTLLSEDDERLPELPTPATIYTETKRHWFWASFSLIRENDAWHIQSMTDEYSQALDLPPGVIRKRVNEINQSTEKVLRSKTAQQIAQMTEDEHQEYIGTTLLPIEQALYYIDILARKGALERDSYEGAARQAIVLGQQERGLLYLQAVLERFPEEHAEVYRRIADLQHQLAVQYAEEDDEERETFYLDQAEKSLFASLELAESAEVHLALADVLLEGDERLNEAKTHLLQAKSETNKPDVEAHIEMHLGEIALEQEQTEQALRHFQRTVELQPTSADYWEALGDIQQTLEQFPEAETSYQRAIELDPHDPERYSVLGLLYKSNDQEERSIQILKDGLAANPSATQLYFYLAGAYQGRDDFQQAEEMLDKAALLEPDSEILASYREILALAKLSQTPTGQKQLKLAGSKKKKKRQH